jgi:anti-sigma regulatory factor (Ser/Thr protein kinase)
MADRERSSRVPAIRLGFAHDPRAPRLARDAVDALFGAVRDRFTENVRLAASELVTNVILHTRGGGELRGYATRGNRSIRLEVEDHLALAPSAQRPPPEQIDGRGLQILDDVAQRWGVRPTAVGKVVWAEFSPP